ncbi:lytic transglycosylase domain-containing protein [Pontixanthobacter aquaemixtae]|uniref:Transglycosylase SLT domain-containing protein n=1 Tax=Pontixanthobacter aquaemixtae TaxID=1958940 RepID=A0A844ZTU5_9SPHN|nr:lytic transglycosylase domain-containing protein [Pontixanthobacter aquaemixtae]MXO90416.1 transglycosylase SLT domain-containing protein [Pontixanthobacter aquaemixtae]
MTQFKLRFGLLHKAATIAGGAIAISVSTPVLADEAIAISNNSAAEYFRDRANSTNVPQLLSNPDRVYYTNLFDAIDGQDWTRVEAMLNERSDGPLHQVAIAEYYLHANSPRVEGPQIQKWLSAGRALPHAEQMGRLGERRGLEATYSLPQEQSLVSQPYASKRIRPRTVQDGTMPGSIRNAILDRIKNDDPDGARQLLDGIDASLSSAARAEWRQRVAFSYYIENNDPAAFAMAQTVNSGGSGGWVAEGNWVAGLAAWRMQDCGSSAVYFEQAAIGSTNDELTAAARYWASRSYVRCRAPEKVTEQLRAAAQLDETLYGMLAREQLGQHLPQSHSADFDLEDWQKIRSVDNVRTAVGLAEIGRDNLADEVLRHQAKIGDASQYRELSRLARELGLPSTQLWMAHNAPRGTSSEPALRYPAPRWTPVTGWKVDPALAYAHTLQESNFRASVVSPAGARGLMQIMPAAAIDHRGTLGIRGTASDLSKPEVNLAFGQEHLNMLRNSSATQGLLPKIMAAYNAGLTPVTRWNTEIRDQGDALLYMESIPYWETRGYVAIVMRNYWMYERQAGGASESRRALAQGMWPTFPDMSGNSSGRYLAQN